MVGFHGTAFAVTSEKKAPQRTTMQMLVSFADDLVWRVESGSLGGSTGLNAPAKMMLITLGLLEITLTSAMNRILESPETIVFF